MTTKHMMPTREEILDDTACLLMIGMMVLTHGPTHPVWKAVVANDARWMGRKGSYRRHIESAIIDCDYYQTLSAITFEI